MTGEAFPEIDPDVRLIAEAYVAKVATGRAVKAIIAMLKNGSVTTNELSAMSAEWRVTYSALPRTFATGRPDGRTSRRNFDRQYLRHMGQKTRSRARLMSHDPCKSTTAFLIASLATPGFRPMMSRLTCCLTANHNVKNHSRARTVETSKICLIL